MANNNKCNVIGYISVHSENIVYTHSLLARNFSRFVHSFSCFIFSLRLACFEKEQNSSMSRLLKPFCYYACFGIQMNDCIEQKTTSTTTTKNFIVDQPQGLHTIFKTKEEKTSANVFFFFATSFVTNTQYNGNNGQ